MAVTLLVSTCPIQTYAEITASAQAPGQSKQTPAAQHNLPVARPVEEKYLSRACGTHTGASELYGDRRACHTPVRSSGR